INAKAGEEGGRRSRGRRGGMNKRGKNKNKTEDEADANAMPGQKGKKGDGKGKKGKSKKGKPKKGKGLTADWSVAKKAATPCMFEVKAKGSCSVQNCAFCHDDATVAAERKRRADAKSKNGKATGPPAKRPAVVAVITGASLVLGGNSCPAPTGPSHAAVDSLPFARDMPLNFTTELSQHGMQHNNDYNFHRHFGTAGEACSPYYSSNYQYKICNNLSQEELCGMPAVCWQDDARSPIGIGAASSNALPSAMPGQVTFAVERISDSGAAEPLGSIAALEAQGVTGIKHLVAKTQNPITFATGAKVTTGDKTLGVTSDLTGSENLYLLSKTCPLVSSQGQTVLKERKPYIWHPDLNDGKPMFFADASAVEIKIKDQSKVQSATRVTNYTPYFLEQITFSNGMVGEAEDDAGAVDEDFDYEQTSAEEDDPAADARESSPEVPKGKATNKGTRAANAPVASEVADAAKGSGDGEVDPSVYPEGELFVPPPPDPPKEARPLRKVGSLIKRLSDKEAESIGAAVDAAEASHPAPDEDKPAVLKADALHCLTHLPKRKDCAVCMRAKCYATPARSYAN
ncbi:MAG: hypothetical protein GY902_03405, partial [Planctomycetes bacterium]|nr:hypothetical protein [Planctomycetota bacterium]